MTYGDNPVTPLKSELCPVYFKKENGEKFQIAFYYSSSGVAYISPHIYNYDVLMKCLLEDNFVKMNFSIGSGQYQAKITGLGFTKSFNSYNPNGLELDIERSPISDY